MPAAAPKTSDAGAARLAALGQRVRAHREALGVSAAAAAQAAGLSRVTLHRIERGEAAVTVGAWLNVLDALGMSLDLVLGQAPPLPPEAQAAVAAPPARPKAASPDADTAADAVIPLADYPQLQRLAWPIAGATVLTAREALGLYERNWRHVDTAALQPQERALLDRLVKDLGNGALLV